MRGVERTRLLDVLPGVRAPFRGGDGIGDLHPLGGEVSQSLQGLATGLGVPAGAGAGHGQQDARSDNSHHVSDRRHPQTLR